MSSFYSLKVAIQSATIFVIFILANLSVPVFLRGGGGGGGGLQVPNKILHKKNRGKNREKGADEKKFMQVPSYSWNLYHRHV